MGKLARLRAQGINPGFGCGTGNPTKNPLMMSHVTERSRNVQFADGRRYSVDKHGTFRRLGVPKPTEAKDEHG